ncbi:MAG: radical SAM/SPASM domain-containing protein [Planctomycetota bacterium]
MIGCTVALEELVLELTDWCPLACRHCSSGSGPGCRHSLSAAKARELVAEGRRLGARQVSFGGGEPTAATAFVETLREVVSSGMKAEVFSCGVARDDEGLGPLTPEVVDALAGVDSAKIIFSFHSADAAIHDQMTAVRGSFGYLLQSLGKCQAAGIHTEANFVPLRPNVAGFDGLLRLLVEHSIRRLSVLRFVPQGRGLANRRELELTPSEESAFVAELIRCQGTSSVAIRTGSPFNGVVPGNGVPCRAGSSKIVIQADGNVIPCEVYKHAKRREWRLSAHEHTLEECLASARFTELRAHLRETGAAACPVHTELRAARNGGVDDGHKTPLAV